MVSSTSGRTSTDANDVCRRAAESYGLIRTSRWTPGLAAEIAVGVFALDVDGRLLDAGRAAVLAVGDLGLEALGLGPHQIHPQQHLGPVAGLGPARPGVDRHEGVAVVVGTAEHRAELERVEIGLGLLGRRADLVVELVGLALLGQLDQSPRGCPPGGPGPRTA